MTRSPSRPTIKLPPKTSTSTEGADPRFSSRKPVRSGFKAPKQSAGEYARQIEARAARAEREAASVQNQEGRWRNGPRVKPDTPRPPNRQGEVARTPAEAPARPAAPIAPTAAAPTQTPMLPRRNSSAREEAPKKVYPKRGIARSTGARAFPPARPDIDGEYIGLKPRRMPDLTTPAEQQPAAPHHRAAPRPAPSPRPYSAPKAAPDTIRHEPRTVHPASEPAPERRPHKEPPRLSKRLSELFGCSRREADEWIENGWVRVDGVVVNILGTRAHPKAKIEVKEEANSHRSESVTILVNKPAGMVAGPTEGGDASALQLIRAESRWTEDMRPLKFKATHLRGLALAGKLDAEATGMVVFTQEGSVARRIVGDDTKLEKEYLVAVEGELSPDDLKRLNFGLELDDIKLKRAEVSWQHENQLRFVLHESKPRQIQRMCEQVGLRVVSIKRLRIGSVSLGKLPAGQWRYLRESERF